MNKHKDLFDLVKVRVFPEKNYRAIWHNLKTIRLGEGVAEELEPEYSEFYDVSIGTRCNAECPFCYVSASRGGIDYPDICETWKKWMDTFPKDEVIMGTSKGEVIKTYKPFQIALGSTGEPTLNSQFCEFLKTVYESGVVPNYTTNGIILSDESSALARKILDATSKYCGGVAVSYGNPLLRERAEKAIRNLLTLADVKVNVHHIISDKKSVDEFLEFRNKYDGMIYYHVLLPLMPSGRSKKGLEDGVWEYLEEKISNLDRKDISFGAHFIKYLETSSKIKTWLYPAESLSKNILLKKDKVVITPSSFNLKPIKVINL